MTLTLPRRAASLPRLGQGQSQRHAGSPTSSASGSNSRTLPAKRTAATSSEPVLQAPPDANANVQQTLLEAHAELAQALGSLYETHATKARDRLDIDRFVKAQLIMARVLGDKVQKDQATSSFMELSKQMPAREAFCDWQLRLLLAKEMNWRQIVNVVNQAILEILQEQVDDPVTLASHARAEQRRAKNLDRRQKLAETAFRQMKDETIRAELDKDASLSRQRRDVILKEMDDRHTTHDWMRQITHNALRKMSPLAKSAPKRFGSSF